MDFTEGSFVVQVKAGIHPPCSEDIFILYRFTLINMS